MQTKQRSAGSSLSGATESLELASPQLSPLIPTSPQAARQDLTQRQRVVQAIENHDVDALRQLAGQRGGFLDQELRKQAWPILLRSNAKGKGKESNTEGWDLDALPARDDERQVRLDIDRSLVNFPHDVRDEDRDQLRVKLERAILTVLRRHPALHYFQGYHDIISVLLLTLEDDDLLIPATERLSLHVVRDSMGPGLEPTLGYLKIVHRLVKAVDPELYGTVSQAASMPFFALSWALTLLSHDLDSVAVLARLFDFLLAHNPSMICHLVVAILLTKKDDLLDVSASCEGDPAIIHSALSQLPSIVLPNTRRAGDASPPDTALSSPTRSHRRDASSGKVAEAADEDDFSEDLMSSASFMASSSDLARSPTLTASSSVSTFAQLESDDEMDASVISTSEIQVGGHDSLAGLRRRRRPSQFGTQDARSSALSASLHGYEADNDHSYNDDLDSLHALDESMFSDPDIEGLAFQPFPSESSRAMEPTTPPRTSRSGNVIVSASSPPDSPSHLPPRRNVIVDELIGQALELSRRYPIAVGPSPSLDDPLADSTTTESAAEADASVRLEANGASDLDTNNLHADRVLGPNSCIYTWARSMDGILTDEEAERIVRDGEGIVFPEALGPDLDDSETVGDEDETSDDLGDADADEYDFVPSPGEADSGAKSSRRGRKRRNRRSSSLRGGRIPPLLALGPHGWLVVSGVAVAAVAYGVYRQQGNAASASAGANGLGTAGLGLGLGFGGFGGAAGHAEGVRDAAEYVAGNAGAPAGIGAGGRLV
ncbi:hypothetical protein JCM10908_004723 [Rhodotorula pacifica]|uniref:GTPase-activating protein GYP8 n=1 Tax=Rhodotorula pacifica TaxID=1495444 RepID=UPI0031822242